MNHKYQILETIGEGAYGIVYKCKNTETNEIVAIKKFIELYEKLPKKEINREIFLLQISKHENIVKFIEAFINKGYLFLVFDYAEKNLLQLIEENPKGLNQELIRSLTYQMCKGVSYLHKKNIIHRDIKPENILIKDYSKVEICDFGFARKMKIEEKTNNLQKMTDYVATRWYRAPEVILGQGNYGPEIDFWSIGCLMGEMSTGKVLFPGDNQINQLEYIIKILGNLPEYLVNFYDNNPNFNTNKLYNVEKPKTLEKIYGKIMSLDALDFMKGLLELDPKKRLNADTVFEHKYFECYKNKGNNENNDNNLIFSFCMADKKKIQIPNLVFNNNEKESKIINIFRYNDESFISETNESTLSKKKIKNPEKNYNNLIKSFQNKKHRHYRSDMVDFGNLYLLSENNRKREKNKDKDKGNKREENNNNIEKLIEDEDNINEENNNRKDEKNNKKEENNKQKEEYEYNNKKEENKNEKISQKIKIDKFNELNVINSSRSQLNQLLLNNKGLNHKISFSMLKNNNINSLSNKSNTEENYPLLTPNFLALNKLSEKKLEKEPKKNNYFPLFNSLKLENIKNPFLNQITQKSKKIILIPKYNSESKNKNKYKFNNNIKLRNRVINNKYYKSLKRNSFDNFISEKQIIFENDEFKSSKKIVNLYENTFKDIILNYKGKEKISPSPIKRKSIIIGLSKNINKKKLDNSFKKQEFQLPPIFNFHIELTNSNKKEKKSKNISNYKFGNIINRYKLKNI